MSLPLPLALLTPHDIFLDLRREIFTTPLESIGTLFGVVNIILLVRRSIWNYPAGIVSVSLLAYVFFHTQLFSDTLLQLFFIVVQIVGWIIWLRHREPDGEVIVTRSTPRDLLLAIVVTAAGASALGLIMQRYAHAAFPFSDATVASASVVAQLLLTWRRLENWIWWIGANVISITVYNLKGLHILAALYCFYLIMSTLGFAAWLRQLRSQKPLLITRLFGNESI